MAEAPVGWCVAASVLLALTLAAQARADDRDDGHDEDTPADVDLHGPPAPEPPEVVARDDQGRVTLRANRLSEPFVLDGKLDDAIYTRVTAVSDFIQQVPDEGEPATEKTEAWVFFDDRNIYVGMRCWDSHPERMVVNEMRRDNFGIYQNESVTVVFDTFYDRRNGFMFQTNPLGALRDQQFGDEGQAINRDWNTVWDVKASTFEQGWIVEIAVPFKSLRYKAGRDQVWSINIRRAVKWKNEDSYLSLVARSHGPRGVYRMSESATLVGLEAPASSRNLELKAYGITASVTNNDAEPVVSNDWNADAGFDVKYGLTRGLIADFTYNTDFAQVEEDQQQVNLTRFSLFFPEKREFFLEGASIFSFAGVQSRPDFGFRPGRSIGNLTPIMFFSRRIGLTSSGVDPIQVGGRVTGRAGPFRVGALNIQTRGVEGFVEPTNFAVLRFRRDILRRSDIGVIATHRTTSLSEPGTSNSLFGLDGNFFFGTNVTINTYYALSHTPLATGTQIVGDETSYLGRFDYNGDRYGLQVQRLKVGEAFRPELGFTSRQAFTRSFVEARFSPRPASIDLVRRFVFQGTFDYITGEPTGKLQTRRAQAQFKAEFEAGDELTVEYNPQFEFLAEEFEISDGIILPIGGYDFQDVHVAYRFGAQRPVPGFVSYRTGSFFSGGRNELAFNGRIEVTPKFSLEPRLSLNWVSLEEGDFAARLVSSRITYSMSPRMFVGGLFQWNSTSNTLSSDVRFRWEYEPGSDLFVVYSDGRLTNEDGFPILLNRTFAVKFTKLFRF